MTGKYQPYPAYKESGVEWIREVPKHWGVAELKRYAYVQGGYAFDSRLFLDSGEPVIRIGDINQDGSVSLNNCKCVSSTIAEKYSQFTVKNGELVMAMTGATIGKAGWYKEEEPALVNQRVGVYKCTQSKLDYRYMWFVLNSSGYQEYIRLTAFGGAQPNISDAGMVAYKTTIPNVEEQTQIANFLDHETAKIDTLIAKQEKLIELLQEKRQAVISHAVTKGLDPDVPMKDSGVEWLGEVPTHWEIKKFKNIFTIKKRIANSSDYKVLSITQKGIKIKDIESGEGQLSMDYSKYQLVEKGDFAMNQMDLLTGFVDISEYQGVTSPDYRVFCLKCKKNCSQYFLYLLQMCYFEKIFFPLGKGAAHLGRWRLPKESFNVFFSPAPPDIEQQRIAEYLHEALKRIEPLIQKTKKMILSR